MVAVEHPDPPEEAKFNHLQVDADELSSGNEAHAIFFGVFLFGNMATPNYPTVWATDPSRARPNLRPFGLRQWSFSVCEGSYARSKCSASA